MIQAETIGLLLMSVAIFQYGAIPIFADLNSSHAMNDSWPKHARFHIVTQVITGACVASVAMYMIWSPNVEHSLGVCIAVILSFCVLGPFFLSSVTSPLYGGSLSNLEEGAEPSKGLEPNTINFGAAILLLIIGRLLII